MSDPVRNMERIEELALERARAHQLSIQVRWLPFEEGPGRNYHLQLITSSGESVKLTFSNPEVEAFDSTTGTSIRECLDQAVERLLQRQTTGTAGS